MPLVSIVITTYNRSNLISRAVKSVLEQTIRDFELIIVDDGSTDNTDRIISKFDDERIRYFKLEINAGQNPALNYGIAQTNGEYIAFLDSDDEWLSSFLEKALSVFVQDPTLGAVYSRAFGCTNEGVLYDGYQFSLQGNVYKEVLAQGYLSYMITIVVKKEIIDMLRPYPFDPDFIYGQDDDFCIRIAKMSKIGLVMEPLAIIHNDGLVSGGEPSISKNFKLVAEGRRKLINKYKDDILEYCGKEVLSMKYLLLSKFYVKSGNIEEARLSALSSYNLAKSFKSISQLLYCKYSLIRWANDIYEGIYKFMFNKIMAVKRLIFKVVL